MKKLKGRSVCLLVLVIAILSGLCLFGVRYAQDGAAWAAFRANGNLYRSGRLTRGNVTDRSGVSVARLTEERTFYADDVSTRRAMVHLLGDRQGNIDSALLPFLRERLTGYDPINGVWPTAGEGETVVLSVSAKLSRVCLDALDGRNGTIMLADYRTGEILAMASSPAYDPDDLPSDPAPGSFLNKALRASFTPGSVFKLVTLAAALEELNGVADRSFHCEGSLAVGGGTVTCTRPHGELKLDDALAVSCNCVFAELAVELGGETMEEYSKKLGLTEEQTISGVRVSAGRYERERDELALAWSGAGQGKDLVVPASLLRYVCAIANHGKAQELTFLKGEITESKELLPPGTANKIADMMAYSVVLTYGEENYPGIRLAAKSGTAEVGGGKSPHAWFTGFIRDVETPLAFVVLVENGGWGSVEAGAAANRVLQASVPLLWGDHQRD